MISATRTSRDVLDRSSQIYSKKSLVRKGSSSGTNNKNRKPRKDKRKWPVSSKHVDVPFHAAVTHSLELLLHHGEFSPCFLSTGKLWLALENSRTEQQESSCSWVFLPYSSLFAPCLGFGVFFLFVLFQLMKEVIYCCLFFSS